MKAEFSTTSTLVPSLVMAGLRESMNFRKANPLSGPSPFSSVRSPSMRDSAESISDRALSRLVWDVIMRLPLLLVRWFNTERLSFSWPS